MTNDEDDNMPKGEHTLVSNIMKTYAYPELAEFYQKLASTQTDLPDELARTLRDGIWSLYESTITE